MSSSPAPATNLAAIVNAHASEQGRLAPIRKRLGAWNKEVGEEAHDILAAVSKLFDIEVQCRNQPRAHSTSGTRGKLRLSSWIPLLMKAGEELRKRNWAATLLPESTTASEQLGYALLQYVVDSASEADLRKQIAATAKCKLFSDFTWQYVHMGMTNRIAEAMDAMRREEFPELYAPKVQCPVDDDHALTDATVGKGALVESLTDTLPNNVSKSKKGKGKDIDAKMLKVLADNPGSSGWSCGRWAQHLRCSKSTIAGTKTWKERLMPARALLKVDAITRMDRSGTKAAKRHNRLGRDG